VSYRDELSALVERNRAQAAELASLQEELDQLHALQGRKKIVYAIVGTGIVILIVVVCAAFFLSASSERAARQTLTGVREIELEIPDDQGRICRVRIDKDEHPTSLYGQEDGSACLVVVACDGRSIYHGFASCDGLHAVDRSSSDGDGQLDIDFVAGRGSIDGARLRF
jgi:hypothetical protein